MRKRLLYRIMCPRLRGQSLSMFKKAIKGLSRLEELIKRSRDINIHHPNNIELTLNDFCRALALMHSSKLRNYSLPLLLDEVWQLAILDMEYYGYVCWYSVYFYGGSDFASNEIALTCPLHIPYDPLAFEFESFEEGQTALALAFQEKYGRTLQCSINAQIRPSWKTRKSLLKTRFTSSSTLTP